MLSSKNTVFQKIGSILLILIVWLIFVSFLRDFRFTDPDQYFHLTVARYQSETGDLMHLPHVKGMGWDEQFVDKEFLFHQFLKWGYRCAGETGVWFVFYAMSFTVLVALFLLVEAMTGSLSLGILAALTPLLSDAFVVRLLVLRAYTPAITCVLALLFFLYHRKRWGVFLSCFLFMEFYHAFYISLAILAVFFFVMRKEKTLFLWALFGLALGIFLNPYFPQSLSLLILPISIAFQQMQNTTLPFGPELEPYRSDHLLLVFRFCFLFVLFALTTVAALWFRSAWIRRQDSFLEKTYFFISGVILVFFFGLMISPRFQEYLVPLVSVQLALSLTFWRARKKAITALLVFVILIMIVARPYRSFGTQMQNLKAFDNAYFSILATIKEPQSLFNCEWWGGHYAMATSPRFAVLDVLDPTLLLSHDRQLFSLMTDLRQNKIVDPYHLLSITGYRYVLCSSKTPLQKYLSSDPRFTNLSSQSLGEETLYLYELNQNTTAPSIQNWHGRENLAQGVVSKDYYYRRQATECEEFVADKRPPGQWLAVSGQGQLEIFDGNEKILETLSLREENQWGELWIANLKNVEKWRWRLCPQQPGQPVALAVFLMTDEQKKKICHEMDKTRLKTSTCFFAE